MKQRYAFILASLLLLLLTSCGNILPSTPTHTFQPTTLRVVRPKSTLGYSYPALDRTITNATTTLQLYQMALALPPFTSGIINCPADFGVEYQLTFSQPSQTPQHMTLDASGCQFLTIASPPQHARFSNDAFRNLLAHMIGLPSLVPKLRP
jgi:hypothetical protein